jgi:ubiquinone/menaquinone biosynthesis C-methylase UbiE
MAVEFRFEDGAAYERAMGAWSRLAGAPFLDWLALPPRLRWIDIGCGNGAFTELIVERCAPAAVHGVDPSAAQLTFARMRPGARMAEFSEGDAQALSFPDRSFDVAVMALVIFFVPDPTRAIAEMARVTRPGGTIATYAWDMLGGGFPLEPFRQEMHSLGIAAPFPPSAEASRVEALQVLWKNTGLEAIETREIGVERTFASFDEFWSASLGSSIGAAIAKMKPEEVERLKSGLRMRMPADEAGRITYGARANAVKGRMPR